MTERERFLRALEHRPFAGHVPHYENVFFLTMEAFGKMHPAHRWFGQWNQMSERERRMHREDIASLYLAIAERYHHSAIFVEPNLTAFEDVADILRILRERSGEEYLLMMHGDTTFPIPTGDDMLEFSARLFEDPEGIKSDQRRNVDTALEFAARLKNLDGGRLLDCFILCSDYCFNVNPFYTPDMFSDLIAPALRETIAGYHGLGYKVIKHTDGNIMPIVEQIVECGPDALHSLDPQGGVDLKVMKARYGDKICLIGNVNCALLQTGTEEEAAADVRRALRDGMPGFGYVFSTSNCVYTGMPLERYELMNDIWWREGVYPGREE